MTIQAPFELDELTLEMESWPAERIVEWALSTFGGRIAVAASMADTVLVHMATQIDPDVEVVFLDTGFHFSETLVTLRRAQSRYRLNLRVERAAPDAPDLFEVGTEGCCAARKVALLDRALLDKDAWMTGLRRTEASTRANAPIVSRDNRGLVKICPLANWSDDDVARYIADHDVIVNPLQYEGYPSIGCWPCTEPVLDGEDPRAGRWRGSGKTECGLHFS
jgi:phosphoadenosine phosphosulfate reductase